MRTRKRTTLAILIPMLAFLAASSAYAVSSINVPLDSWVYPAIEKLDGFGLLRSNLEGTRPFTRMEVARLVHEALMVKKEIKGPLPPLADFLLERFEKEYGEELGAYDVGDRRPVGTFFKPLDEVKTRYVYVDGEPRTFVNLRTGEGQFPEAGSRILATEGSPLVYNNEGVIYGKGSNYSLQFSSTFRLMEIFSAYAQPIFLVRRNNGGVPDLGGIDESAVPGSFGEFDRVDMDLHKGYAKFSPWNMELEVGRDSMWWGHGRHGGLLLTNNAAPFALVKLSNPSPTLLPWYFYYLGPFKYTYFMSILEGDLVTDPWMTGLRLDFKPFPNLEIGVMNTFLYNGKGEQKLSLKGFIGSLTGFGFSAANNVNQIAGVDFRLQLPFLRNTEVYAEYSGDDSGGFEYPEEYPGLGDIGYMIGIYAPRLTNDGKSDLRLEFAHNAHRVDSSPGFWYGHTIYPYTHDGMIMGHHMGPDALDFFARTTRYLKNNLIVGLDYDYMARGLTLSPTEELVHQVGADAAYDLNDWTNICIRYGFEAIENFNVRPGVDTQNHLFMTTVKFRF